MRSLIIDNYDSYTYNLYQLIGKVSGIEPIVIKNDEMTYDEILNLDFDNVILSPGPGSPDKEKDFGICKDIIEKLNKPILGICLGHQGIYYYHGGKVVRAEEPMHGRQSSVNHNGNGLFKGIKIILLLLDTIHSLVKTKSLMILKSMQELLRYSNGYFS